MSNALALVKSESPSALVPRTYADFASIGKVLAVSGFFQDARGEAQAIVKVMAGAELGIPPVASMTGIHVIKGKISLSSNLIAAAIRRSGHYDYRVLQLTAEICEIEFLEIEGKVVGDKRYGVKTPIGKSEFTMKEAVAAKLHQDYDKDSKSWKDKATWKNFPKNMLFARAISNGAKWYCPEVFSGPIYTPEEMGAEVDGETGEPLLISAPATTADRFHAADQIAQTAQTKVTLPDVPVDAKPVASIPEISPARAANISRLAEIFAETDQTGDAIANFERYKAKEIDGRSDKELSRVVAIQEKRFEKWQMEQEARREAEAEALEAKPVDDVTDLVNRVEAKDGEADGKEYHFAGREERTIL